MADLSIAFRMHVADTRMILRAEMEKELEKKLDRHLDRLSLNAFMVCIRKSADNLHPKAVDLLGSGADGDDSALRLIFEFLRSDGRAGGSEVVLSNEEKVGGETWSDRLTRELLPSAENINFVGVRVYQEGTSDIDTRIIFEDFVYEGMLVRELEELVHRRDRQFFPGAGRQFFADSPPQGGMKEYWRWRFARGSKRLKLCNPDGNIVMKQYNLIRSEPREEGRKTVGQLFQEQREFTDSHSRKEQERFGGNFLSHHHEKWGFQIGRPRKTLYLLADCSSFCFHCGGESSIPCPLLGPYWMERMLSAGYDRAAIYWFNGEARCGNCWGGMLNRNGGAVNSESESGEYEF